MRSVPLDILSRLDLEGAARREADATEPLIPSSPGTDQLKDNAAPFASWLGGQLRAGLPTGRGLVIAVAKPVTGSRPVAIWGFAERVTYRALTDLLMTEAKHEVDRSPERYRDFISAPMTYAEERGTRPDDNEDGSPFATPWPADAIIQYVVKADLASFYDYIDHDILGRELLVRTGDHAAVECLLDLLGEVQGRRYGLPQLLEPSDRLSDLYAGRVLRALRRKQWAAWRFNDDFRIAVETFEDAKRALDDLAAAARDNGLVLNESKTRTPSITSYWHETVISQVDAHLPRDGAEHDPADFVADYTEGARDSDPEWALSFLESTVTPRGLRAGVQAEGQTNLRDVDRFGIRYIRRALIRLADPGEPRALSVLSKTEGIVAFVASATPYVLRYLRAMVALDRSAVTRIVEAITADVSLSSWQRLCLLRAIGDLDLLDSEPLSTWVEGHRAQRFEPVVRAEAALALAAVNRIEAQEITRGLDEEPSALASWYLVALQRLHDCGAVNRETCDAVREEGGLHETLLVRS
ncbi:reverse transcriptase domain-containing protein [Micromonospora halotolerans]|uniref:Reverse transcriptase domain-containing protein n=1 Tax=Micromonospora halotolerans TaxID=709879 RepID=A0ABY9ZQV2_9ACTN|nr:reverse transcriptase domain-containing protein [Micromonospora halotolerans]WNM37565.1 reverse transcriptase domain-containing protein [Micromonospora halotolerans]